MSNIEIFMLIAIICLIVSNIVLWLCIKGLDYMFKALCDKISDVLEEAMNE